MVYFFWYWFYKITARLFYGYRVVHGERLIEEGGAVVASNHASFLDPPIVGIGHKKPICYLARKTLFRNRFFGWLIRKCKAIPVDQERPDATGLKMILRRLKEGNRVLIFPEGSRSWDGNLQEGQRGVGLLVAKSGVPVVPVRLFGTYEALPRGESFYGGAG